MRDLMLLFRQYAVAMFLICFVVGVLSLVGHAVYDGYRAWREK